MVAGDLVDFVVMCCLVEEEKGGWLRKEKQIDGCGGEGRKSKVVEEKGG